MPVPVPSLAPFHTSEIFMPNQQEKCPQANQITISYMLYFELKTNSSILVSPLLLQGKPLKKLVFCTCKLSQDADLR